MNILRQAKPHRYEVVAFLTGAAVMVLEIVGTRLLSPNFGTSTYVWTAMIGVILGSLAIGFAVGGKLADRYESTAFLGYVLFVAAMLVLGIGLYQNSLLASIAGFNLDLRIGAFLAALLLFALPSTLIGMVSPHLAKMSVTSLDSTGQSIGRLEAAGTIGSIAGTFSCGYFLLGQFGSRSIVIGIVFLLLITSFIANPSAFRKVRLIAIAITFLLSGVARLNPPNVQADIDSPYARYRVLQGDFAGRSTNMLMMDSGGIQSAVHVNQTNASKELVFPYTQQFFSAATAYGKPARVLVIGGGTYTLPSALVQAFPNMQVDVAEIDPALDGLAKDYFHYKQSPRLTIHHSDGRVYLNNNKIRYDIIYFDAYSSLSPPFQLTTREAVARIEASLVPNGVVVANLVGRYRNGNETYLQALHNTYQDVFTNVAMYQSRTDYPLDNLRQNFILYAANSRQHYDPIIAQAHKEKPLAIRPGGLVLTDDFAPTERLTF